MSGVILGLDFGEKRIGVALSDPDRTLSMPLTTIQRTSDSRAIQDILRLTKEHQVQAFVVGEPRNLDGTRGPSARRAKSFARKLARDSGLKVQLIDEALSTVAAEERLREAGLSGPALKKRLDSVAAQILLQEALDQMQAIAASDQPQSTSEQPQSEGES